MPITDQVLAALKPVTEENGTQAGNGNGEGFTTVTTTEKV